MIVLGRKARRETRRYERQSHPVPRRRELRTRAEATRQACPSELPDSRERRNMLRRREFLRATAGAALAPLADKVSGQETKPAHSVILPTAWAPKKSVLFSMLPGHLSLSERFQLVRDVG